MSNDVLTNDHCSDKVATTALTRAGAGSACGLYTETGAVVMRI